MSDACESEPLVFADEQPDGEPSGLGDWNVLVVDDDTEVHKLTRLVLEGKSLVGKRIKLHSAWTAAEAEEILAKEDIACILLDVAMESDDAGLRLVESIRNRMCNSRVRIILRTGQPGQAPEGSVIERYEINDYREKTELTAQKLTTSVTAALRSYRDISTIERSRLGMRMIVDASAEMNRLESPRIHAIGVLRLFASLLRLWKGSAYEELSAFAAETEGEKLRVMAGIGAYEGFEDRVVDPTFGTGALETIGKAVECRESVYAGDCFALVIENGRGKAMILYLERSPPTSPLERELVDLSESHVRSAFSNITMYDELQGMLRERDALLREVHHRVKNNLQIISSLIDIAAGSSDRKPMDILLDVKDRIQSIAVVHDRVYESESLEFVDFAEAARFILERETADEAPGKRVECVSSIGAGALALTRAIPCALLFRELAANAFRHAASSPGAERMSVRVGPSSDGRLLEISIRAGSREGRSDLSGEGAVGRTLVKALVDQLKANFAMSEEEGLAVDFAVSMR